MARPYRIAVIGTGKIACDQHLPAIALSPDFELVATASPDDEGVADVPHFASFEALCDAGLALDAVSLCTPPQVRGRIAQAAIARGVHVLLEKPPGTTLSEVAALDHAAREKGVTLFASWHSRFAAGVAPARAWLADRRIGSVAVHWREDVRVWHPGQRWIWRPGGLGVFDPGINALSILTEILPGPLALTSASLDMPENCAAPTAAQIQLELAGGAPVSMDLDFLQVGPQTWDIVVETEDGVLKLGQGGAAFTLPDGEQAVEQAEYPALYRHFAELIASGQCDVDVRPMQLVADAYLVGEQKRTVPFIE